MRKTKVVLVTLSAANPDGSRDVISEAEICSCKDPHDAEIILDCLRNIRYKEYNYTNHHDEVVNREANRNECMQYTSIRY